MRWPFSFGRAQAAKGAASTEPRRPVREWASLPAIQRTAGEPQLTAATAAFVDSLAGTHDPDLSAGPLGHHVSPEAPAGLVTGLARTVQTYAPSTEFVARPRGRRETPVQRSLAGAGEADAVPAPHAEPAPEDALVSFTAIDEPVPSRAPLTRLSDSDATAVMRLAGPRPAMTEPQRSTSAEAISAEPTAEVAQRPVVAQRLSLGQSRRLGLGAPLSRHEAASVQRAVGSGPLDLAPPARVEKATSGEEATAPRHRADERRLQWGAPQESTAPIAGPIIQRAGEAAPASTQPAAEPADLAPALAAGGSTAAKTQERVAIQRVIATSLPPVFPRPAVERTAPLVAERPSLLTVRRPGEPLDIAVEAAEHIAVQRAQAAVPSAPPRGPAELGFAPALQPAVHAVTAAPRTVSAGGPPVLAALPPVQRLPRPPAIAHDFTAVSPFASGSADFPVQRVTTILEPAAVQRESDEASAPGMSATAGAVAAAASAGAEAAVPGAHTDKELDELARKLHDRITLNLRRDLLIQRERAGLITDWR